MSASVQQSPGFLIVKQDLTGFRSKKKHLFSANYPYSTRCPMDVHFGSENPIDIRIVIGFEMDIHRMYFSV